MGLRRPGGLMTLIAWLGRGVCVGNGVNVAEVSTDKVEKCLMPKPGLEPLTTRFPLCAPKLQYPCATHAATEPNMKLKEYWLNISVQNCKSYTYYNKLFIFNQNIRKIKGIINKKSYN